MPSKTAKLPKKMQIVLQKSTAMLNIQDYGVGLPRVSRVLHKIFDLQESFFYNIIRPSVFRPLRFNMLSDTAFVLYLSKFSALVWKFNITMLFVQERKIVLIRKNFQMDPRSDNSTIITIWHYV